MATGGSRSRPDSDPAADPWTLAADQPTIDIASGDESDFDDAEGVFSDTRALAVAVEAVRSAVRRNGCPHETPAEPEHRHCSRCGVQLDDQDRWRWEQ